MEGNFEIQQNTGQGTEKVKELCGKLDLLTSTLLEKNPQIKTMLYFGSRLDPNKTPRDDSDLDYMVVTNSYVAEPYPIHQQIQSEIGINLGVKTECHCTIPKGNISIIKQRTPGFWRDVNPSLCYNVCGSEDVVAQIRQSIQSIK